MLRQVSKYIHCDSVLDYMEMYKKLGGCQTDPVGKSDETALSYAGTLSCWPLACWPGRVLPAPSVS